MRQMKSAFALAICLATLAACSGGQSNGNLLPDSHARHAQDNTGSIPGR